MIHADDYWRHCPDRPSFCWVSAIRYPWDVPTLTLALTITLTLTILHFNYGLGTSQVVQDRVDPFCWSGFSKALWLLFACHGILFLLFQLQTHRDPIKLLFRFLILCSNMSIRYLIIILQRTQAVPKAVFLLFYRVMVPLHWLLRFCSFTFPDSGLYSPVTEASGWCLLAWVRWSL